MRIFNKTFDGGPNSSVQAYFLIEIKGLISIALLKFNKGGRDVFHTHAFNALTWFIKGDIIEHDINGDSYIYNRTILPKITRRSKNHKVLARETSWVFTIRGPWVNTWTEDTLAGKHTVLTHGRKEVK